MTVRMLTILLLTGTALGFVNGKFGSIENLSNILNSVVEPSNSAATEAATIGDDVGLSCVTSADEEGRCVRSYQCESSDEVDGVGIIDVRFSEECRFYMNVCCRLSSIRTPNDPVTPKPNPKREGCGWQNPEGVDMPTKGETKGETKFGEFPWMVAVLETRGRRMMYVGGGSLIDKRVVLTGAHVAKVPGLRIRAGEWDTLTTGEIYPHQDRNVSFKITHPQFQNRNLRFDVALLFLSSPVDPAPHIGFACLPRAFSIIPSATKCIATGWGKDKFKGGQYQKILKKLELPVVEHLSCRDQLRKTRLGPRFELHHTFMCAGGSPGTDTCKGDGGSPLVCPVDLQPGRFVQSGMVAWGIGCGEEGLPGVYVDLAMVREWIDEQMRANNVQTLEYDNY